GLKTTVADNLQAQSCTGPAGSNTLSGKYATTVALGGTAPNCTATITYKNIGVSGKIKGAVVLVNYSSANGSIGGAVNSTTNLLTKYIPKAVQ
ncbi:MAG: prepilin-type cleavage/methylation domain-containing protein, partial [Gammaproteobacteria bacterium]|nr:prepilin-type cleavage/methylation domain-containing protein [Gammaproteobacteria bacterium]